MNSMMSAIELASVIDWAGFSHAVRALRAEGVAPASVSWRVPGPDGGGDLFEVGEARPAAGLASAPPLRLPRAFVDAARDAFLHADPDRLPLLHRLALRVADDPLDWTDTLHPDRLRLDRLQREVRREIHKMHAFVRFRPVFADRGAAARTSGLASPASAMNGTAADDAFVTAMDAIFDGAPPRADAVARALAPARLAARESAHEVARHDAAAHVAAPAMSDQRAIDAESSGASAPARPPLAGDAAAPGGEGVVHVAWFEPDHHVLEAAAPFFARRFATMRWAILTPRVSVSWDGRTLAFGPGARQADAPAADAGESLWLAYYRSIFNPARVKLAMMKKEMPVRFWKNLPEAAAIAPLLSEAPRRAHAMVEAGGALRLRRRGQVDVQAPDAAPAAARSLDELRRHAARCRDCPVADVATQTVFGEGHPQARLMIVGEQPGDHEDLRGLPFQGPAGQLLRAAFAELGWDERALYLTNAVKHFHHELRGQRRLHKTPSQREAEACLHWLEAEIAALRPQAVVALGATAARSLLGGAVPVQANAGQWLARADGIPVLVCLHPAAILRMDDSQRDAARGRWIASLRAADPYASVQAPREGADGPPPALAA